MNRVRTIKSKKNKFAIDGALIEKFMEENSKHLPNTDFIDLYKVLLKASGFIYNTNSMLPYHISRTGLYWGEHFPCALAIYH